MSLLWPVVRVEFASGSADSSETDGPPGMYPVARAELDGQSFAYWWSQRLRDPFELSCDGQRVVTLAWFQHQFTSLSTGSPQSGISGRSSDRI